MKKLLFIVGFLPAMALPQQTGTPYRPDTSGAIAIGFLEIPFGAKGDCKTDDSAAIQKALDERRAVYLPRPPGGCYLVSKTLILRGGDYLYAASANDPNADDPAAGVVIRLMPGRNVPILRTYTSLQGSGNEYMDVENIVFDGNGSLQTRELHKEALVDFRAPSSAVCFDTWS